MRIKLGVKFIRIVRVIPFCLHVIYFSNINEVIERYSDFSVHKFMDNNIDQNFLLTGVPQNRI